MKMIVNTSQKLIIIVDGSSFNKNYFESKYLLKNNNTQKLLRS